VHLIGVVDRQALLTHPRSLRQQLLLALGFQGPVGGSDIRNECWTSFRCRLTSSMKTTDTSALTIEDMKSEDYESNQGSVRPKASI
jgi:hypothetical protein